MTTLGLTNILSIVKNSHILHFGFKSPWQHEVSDCHASSSVPLVLKPWHPWIITLGREHLAFCPHIWELNIEKSCFVCCNETQWLGELCRRYCFCNFPLLEKGSWLLENKCIVSPKGPVLLFREKHSVLSGGSWELESHLAQVLSTLNLDLFTTVTCILWKGWK